MRIDESLISAVAWSIFSARVTFRRNREAISTWKTRFRKKMGLISDRKSRAKRDKDSGSLISGTKGGYQQHHYHQGHHHNHYHNFHPAGVGVVPPGKRGIYGPKVLPTGSQTNKYPAGYYTTPVHSSSSAGRVSSNGEHYLRSNSQPGSIHPGQPKSQPNVNPRYQTWVAPRKQPSLGQLVRRLA